MPSGTQHQPIATGTWSGSGTYVAVGGIWDPVSHTFTVSPVQLGTSGTPVSIDLAQVQRVLVADPVTDWALGASFPAGSGELQFTATLPEGHMLYKLETQLEPSHLVRGAWDFDVAGAGWGWGWPDPVYLSFDIGPGFSLSDLDFWRYEVIQWHPMEPISVSYDGRYVSFAVFTQGAYAVSAVPEPGSILLLLGAGLAMLAYVRARQRR